MSLQCTGSAKPTSVFVRLALVASFLPAVADRPGL